MNRKLSEENLYYCSASCVFSGASFMSYVNEIEAPAEEAENFVW